MKKNKESGKYLKIQKLRNVTLGGGIFVAQKMAELWGTPSPPLRKVRHFDPGKILPKDAKKKVFSH